MYEDLGSIAKSLTVTLLTRKKSTIMECTWAPWPMTVGKVSKLFEKPRSSHRQFPGPIITVLPGPEIYESTRSRAMRQSEWHHCLYTCISLNLLLKSISQKYLPVNKWAFSDQALKICESLPDILTGLEAVWPYYMVTLYWKLWNS